MTLSDLVDSYLSIADYRVPVISPQRDRLVVMGNQTGQYEFYLVDIETGATSHLHGEHTPGGPVGNTVVWAPNGEALYVVGTEFATAHEGTDRETSVLRLSLNGEATRLFTVEGHCDLWSVNPQTGYLYYLYDDGIHYFDPETRTHGTFPEYSEHRTVGGGGASPTGEFVAYTTNTLDDSENSDVFVADPDGSNARKLAVGHRGQSTEARAWHPNGRRLLVAENYFDYDPGPPRLGVYDLDTESVDWLANDRPVAFLAGGNRILAAGPTVYDLDGEETTVEIPGQVRFRYLDGDNLITDCGFVAERTFDSRPTEIVHYDIAAGTTTTLVSPDLEGVDPNAFVNPEWVMVPCPDGSEERALLYDAGVRPSPAVVIVYGLGDGPSRRFDRSAQLLTRLGYTVLSVGFSGEHFTDAEHSTFAAAGEWLAAREWIDEDRVAVYGHSHGGYDAFMQAVRYPEVWAVVVASSGLTDLLAARDYFESTGYSYPGLNDSQVDASHWRSQSPIEYVDGETVPLLITHGTEDDHPVEQARRFVDELRAHGWSEEDDFEYIEREDQGHSTDWHVVVEFIERRL